MLVSLGTQSLIALSVVAACALAACVGDDDGAQPAPIAAAGPNGRDAATPAPSADGGGDASTSDAGGVLPLINEYSVTKTTWPGTKTECVNKVDAAVKALGGGYVLAAGASSSARYGDRSGAVVVGTCFDDDGGKVVTQTWAIKTAANATNDEARLKNLVFDTTAPPVSPAASGFAKVQAAQRVRKVAGLALSTCQNRAKSAIDATSAKAPPSPNKWSTLGGNFMAVGGTDGTTVSITCLGDASGTVMLDVFTIDPAVSTATLLDTLDAAFTASGSPGTVG